MPIDHSDELRREIITHLKSGTRVRGIVGARVHDEPQANAVWPFVRYGFPITGGFAATCLEGSTHRVTLHGFAKGGDKTAISALARAIQLDMEEFEPPLLIEFEWAGTSIIRDTDEADAYHAICQFDIVTAERA